MKPTRVVLLNTTAHAGVEWCGHGDAKSAGEGVEMKGIFSRGSDHVSFDPTFLYFFLGVIQPDR